jgi:hypothetical protein
MTRPVRKQRPNPGLTPEQLATRSEFERAKFKTGGNGENGGQNFVCNSKPRTLLRLSARVKAVNLAPVLFSRKSKPRERFYLLPGQGGRNYFRKQKKLIGWSIVVALFFGLIMATIMWYVSRPKL